MNRIAWASIVTVLAAAIAYGNSMPPEPPATRPAAEAGKIVKGLQLALAADKIETTPDGVVKVTIALVNRGTEPIKYLQYPRLCGPWLKITGPDGKAIQCIRDPRAPQASLPAPDMEHVQELAPGAKWEHGESVAWTVLDPPVENRNRITGKVIRRYDGCGWDIRKPGRYRIVASYGPIEDARKINAKHQANVWDGEVESNPIVFTVKPTEQAPAATAPAATQPVDEKAVGELIRLLGDERFAVREDATKRLRAMGKAIHPILKARLQEAGLDPEITARIRTIVDPTVEVRLRISNQSQRLRAADIRVTIDDKEIVAKVLHVGMGHNFERIVTPLTEGEHTLTVESKAGAVKQEMRIRISKAKRWIDINFWSPPSKFTIEVCAEDRPTL